MILIDGGGKMDLSEDVLGMVLNGPIVQWSEYSTDAREVRGSNPRGSIIPF